MKVTKQLNNNIVIASDDQGREVVLMGKGIGFGCKPGMEPNMALVEKRFFGFSSGAHTQQLAELLDRIPLEHLSLGIEIVEHIQEKIQKPLNETLVLMISVSTESSTYILLFAFADAFFTFLPIFMGVTIAKKMGGSPMLFMTVGAALCYPNLISLMGGSLGELGVFLGMP